MFRTLLFSIVLCFPFALHAEELTIFSLRAGETGKLQWEAEGDITATRYTNGTGIEATGTGILFLKEIEFEGTPQGVEFITSSNKAQHIRFTWRRSERGIPSVRYEYPVFVSAGKNMETRISFGKSKLWKNPITEIGIVVTPGTSINIEEIRFIRWNAIEKFKAVLSSWWSFDTYRLYSINFLWGPQIAWNPLQQALMWKSLPPNSTSGTYLLNLMIVTGVILLLVYCIMQTPGTLGERKTRFLKYSATLIFCAWILLDVRMGSEFLSWVYTDYKEYITAPERESSFRGLDNFYEFAYFVKPLVQDRERYIIFAQQQYPYFANMRYITYPSVPSSNIKSNDTWVVYKRSDMSVSPEGILLIEGEPLTSAGRVLGQFDEHSFVFRSN